MERSLAVVTGASSGIGAEFARQLSARGFDLLLIARREDRLRSLAVEISAKYRVNTEILVADLIRDRDVEIVADRIQRAPNLHLLVNNAGFGLIGFFQNVSIKDQEAMHRLHIIATLALSHAALKNLSSQNTQGGIINVSSVAAFQPSPSNVSYCATKAWINSFTEGLAIELAAQRSNVKVQALCPGFTYSEFHDRLGMDRGPIPKSLWMSAEFVVRESLRGFDRGDLLVIPGWRYRLLVGLMKATPASWMRSISAMAQRRYRRPTSVK